MDFIEVVDVDFLFVDEKGEVFRVEVYDVIVLLVGYDCFYVDDVYVVGF